MKTMRVVLFALILSLAGCNLPSEQAAPTATKPALVLTTAPSSTTAPVIPTQPQPTITAPIKPSATLTAIASLTPTQTITTSPTPNLSDPKAALGKATWEDKFHDGKNWGLVGDTYDDGNTRVEIKNDALYFLSIKGLGWHGWRLTYPKPKNFYLEAVVHNINCVTGDYYGILFRATDSYNGYWFGVSCQGKFNLRAGGVNAWKEPVQAETSTAIQAGANKTNRLGVMVKGNQITLYINGKMVKDISESTYPNAGTFGMFIVGNNPGFAFETEEMSYWELP